MVNGMVEWMMEWHQQIGWIAHDRSKARRLARSARTAARRDCSLCQGLAFTVECRRFLSGMRDAFGGACGSRETYAFVHFSSQSTSYVSLGPSRWTTRHFDGLPFS